MHHGDPEVLDEAIFSDLEIINGAAEGDVFPALLSVNVVFCINNLLEPRVI